MRKPIFAIAKDAAGVGGEGAVEVLWRMQLVDSVANPPDDEEDGR